jgi:hypothetical protein
MRVSCLRYKGDKVSARVRIRVLDDAAPEDLVDLANWLSEAPVVRRAEVVATTTDPEAQGGILDAVQAVLTDAGSLATVAELVYRWVELRGRRPESVRVEAEDGDATQPTEEE